MHLLMQDSGQLNQYISDSGIPLTDLVAICYRTYATCSNPASQQHVHVSNSSGNVTSINQLPLDKMSWLNQRMNVRRVVSRASYLCSGCQLTVMAMFHSPLWQALLVIAVDIFISILPPPFCYIIFSHL